MTFTATAMEKALAHYETGMRDDGETAKGCIVFTDGNPKSDEEIERVPAASKAWAGIGAKVFAVGIGSQITEEGIPFDCYEGDGASYRGRKTTTNSGRICQNWAIQSPHKHSRTVQSRTEHPNYDLTSNYCRNPDESAGPWCYTIDSEKRWEYCGIPRCSIV